MNLSKGFIGTLLIAGIILLSCSYEPTGVNYVEVDQNVRVTPNYTILELEGDTLDATPGGAFSYDFRTDSIRIFRVLIYMNEQVIYESSNSRGTFGIQGRDYETGIYDLDVIVYSSTGTQSIADQGGSETYQTTKKWYVAIDNDPATPVQITRTYKDEQSGGLIVEWEKYNRVNFYRYIVRSTSSGEYSIDDQNQNSLLLPDYFGSETELFVTVEVVGNSSIARSDTVTLESSASRLLSVQQDENQTTEITWSRSPYSHNFISYEIMYNNGVVHRRSVTDINDTTLVIPNSPSSNINRIQLKIRSTSNDDLIVYDDSYDNQDFKYYTVEEREDIWDVKYENGIYFIFLNNNRQNYYYLKAIDGNSREVLRSRRLNRGSYTQFSKDYIVTSEYGSGITVMDYSSSLESEFIDFGYGEFSMNVITIPESNYVFVRLRNDYQLNYSTFKEFYFDLDTKIEVAEEVVFSDGYRIISDNVVDATTNEIKYSIESQYRDHQIFTSVNSDKVATVSYIPAGGQANNPDYKTRFSVFSAPDFNLLSETNFDGNHHILYVNENLTRFLFYFGYLIDSGGYYGYLLVLDKNGNEVSRTNVAHGTYFYQNGQAINEYGYKVDIDM